MKWVEFWVKFMKCLEFVKWVEFTKWIKFMECLEFWVKNLNLCFAVIASEFCERGNPKKRVKFVNFVPKLWVKISVILKQKPEFVILSASEVSKNSKFSFNLCGFFCCGFRLATRWVAFLQRLKMTKRAPKPKNKAFKNFSVPKSASNEREREREVPRPNTVPFSPCWICSVATLCFAYKHHFATLVVPNLPCRRALFCPQTLATLNSLLCYALPNLQCLATPHRTPNFRPKHKAQAPPRSKALR